MQRIKGDVRLLVNTFLAMCILETQKQIEAANKLSGQRMSGPIKMGLR